MGRLRVALRAFEVGSDVPFVGSSVCSLPVVRLPSDVGGLEAVLSGHSSTSVLCEGQTLVVGLLELRLPPVPADGDLV